MLLEAISSRIRKSKSLLHLIKAIYDSADIAEPKGHVIIGKHTYFADVTLKIFSWGENERLVVGKYCMFGYDSIVLLGGEHDLSRVSSYPLRSFIQGQKENTDTTSKGPIIIGNDVWIGDRAIILSGVTIGNGAIVGAGAVVTKSLPAYSIAVGVPAKILRFRFPEDQIRKLLKIAWWNWPEEKIIANMNYFYGDVEDFIKKFWKEE